MKSINRSLVVCTVLFVSFIFVSSLFFLLTTDVQAKNVLAVNVSGNITTNTTWTKANSPYILNGEIEITEGVTLTIEPGVVVMGDSALRAYGHLVAIGTSAEPITFTSANATSGGWGGVSANELGSMHLNHVVAQYGTFNIGSFVQDGAPVTKIENTVTQLSDDLGMVVNDSSLHLTELENVTFQNNVKNRVSIESLSDPVLLDNATLSAQPGLEGYEFYSDIGDFRIPSGITLTLEPGVSFFMPEWSFVRVYGHLEAIGTATHPITFTTENDSVPGNWSGVIVDGQGSMHLNHVVAQYGVFNIGVVSQAGAPISKIENTVTQFGEFGFLLSDYALHLTDLENVTFQNNVKNRVIIETWNDSSALIGDAILSAQPGLEGYEIESYLNSFPIPSGITLTVESGVSVFMEKGDIVVNGRLEAIGTPTQPITFTSIATNTHSWEGITVNNGHTELAHATIQRSKDNGFSILNGSVSARCSTFANNLGNGIFVDAAAQGNIQLAYNSLVSNTVAGLRNESPAWLDARYTWWGAADGPSGSGTGSGDAVTGNIYVTPWLTAPECQEALPEWQVFLPVIVTTD